MARGTIRRCVERRGSRSWTWRIGTLLRAAAPAVSGAGPGTA